MATNYTLRGFISGDVIAQSDNPDDIAMALNDIHSGELTSEFDNGDSITEFVYLDMDGEITSLADYPL